MTTTINASPTNGIVQTADGSGVMKLQSNGVTTNALAWVNFNGTGTVAIRSAYNVSSITDNGTGDYTVNFTNALSDANYAAIGSRSLASSAVNNYFTETFASRTTTATRWTNGEGGSLTDTNNVDIAIFGN